jgi:hypothetical protein
MNPILIISALIALSHLFSLNDKTDKKGPLINIDIEANIKNMKKLNLSQFSVNICYVPLETNEQVLISNTRDFDISKDKILATDNNALFLFDLKGKFLTKFGSKGRGPGEYQFIRDLTISNNKKIYLKSLYDLFEFDINGKFVRKYANIFRTNDYFFSDYYLINDSLFFGNLPNSTGKNVYKASIINKQGKAIQTFKNYIQFAREQGRGFRTEDELAYFSIYKNEMLFKGSYNDTLFQLSDQLRLIPKYLLNFGKYTDPLSERGKSLTEWNSQLYIKLNKFYQTESYLFLVCDFGKYFPAKRLSPKKLKLPTGKVIDSWYIGQKVLGIYDKKAKEISFSKPTNTDNSLFATGLYNDVDAGPRFLPEKMINDSTIVMWIEAKEFKDHIASDDFKNYIPKYPEKKRQLEELAKNVKVFDNPILMIVTFKN